MFAFFFLTKIVHLFVFAISQKIVQPDCAQYYETYSHYLKGRPGMISENGFMAVSINDRCWPKLSQPPEYCCQNKRYFESCWEDLRQTFGMSFQYERCCEGHSNYKIFYREMKIFDDFFDVVLDWKIEGFDPAENNEALVFLHDRKVGGRNFGSSLFVNSWRIHKLKFPIIQDSLEEAAPGGTHFLPQWGSAILRNSELISGHYDWNVFSLLGKNRSSRCLIGIRNPIERFVSYVLHRAENVSYWLNNNLSNEELLARLLEAMPEKMVYNGADLGLFGNLKRNHGMQLSRESLAAFYETYKVDVNKTLEHDYGFRELGGPYNSLLRILDPDYNNVDTAKKRLKKCLVIKLTEDRPNTKRILDFYLPWLQLDVWQNNVVNLKTIMENRVFAESFGLGQQDVLKSKRYLEKMPDRHKKLIAWWQQQDMELYEQGLEQFDEQLFKINSNLQLLKKKNQTFWPVFSWQLPTHRVKKIRDLSPCGIGSNEYQNWFSSAHLLFNTTRRLPRYPFDDRSVRVFGSVFGNCSVEIKSSNSKFKPVVELVEKLWCGFNAFYHSNFSGAVLHFDSIVSMLGQQTVLGKCIDSSPWPFTRAQLLANFDMFHKIAYSPFVTDISPSGFIWVAVDDMHKLRDGSPYAFYAAWDDAGWQRNQQYLDV
eukprot:gene5-106_t